MRELDVVKLKKTVTDQDAYGDEIVTVPAGTEGTIVMDGKTGGDIEFIMFREDGFPYSVVLTLEYDQVELTWEAPR